MELCFEGIGQLAATFQAEDGVRPGMAVALTGSGTVGLGAAGQAPCGVALGAVRNGMAAVQIGGVAKAGFSGPAPAAGWQTLACDGSGGVKTATGGASCLVLAVDEGEGSVVIRL